MYIYYRYTSRERERSYTRENLEKKSDDSIERIERIEVFDVPDLSLSAFQHGCCKTLLQFK